MKAYLILEDGTVFTGTSIGSEREVISEIVFNTSMTGYLEVLTDPSYAGPVSYTHLDVYKRQPMAQPWPVPWFTAVKTAIKNALNRYRSRQKI